MTVFDDATAVRRRADGVYDARPDQRFAIVAAGGATPPAVNGGALIAQVLRAVLDTSPNPHPVATTANFLRVAQLAPAEVRVEWLKQGRTASTARASLGADGPALPDATLLNWPGPPPDFPPIEDCVDLGPWRGSVSADGAEGYAMQVVVLMDPATSGWRGRAPPGGAR